MRVADYIAKFIYEELKVKHIFGVTGAGIMHLTDGIAQSQLQWVAMHDERSCAMAADAYSRASENFGVCMVSTGPAATNAITGVAGAWQDSVPMLVISGQVKRAEMSDGRLRQHGVQELEIIPMVSHITKLAVCIYDPQSIKRELTRAIKVAKEGRPGPVWLEVPMDVQSAEIVEPLPEYTDSGLLFGATKLKKYSNPHPSVFTRLLQESERPVIIAGQGVRMAGAINALRSLAEHHNIPVVMPYLGIDVLPYDHLCNIGPVGVKGTQGANLAMQTADLVLALGTTLHVTVTGYDWTQFAPSAKLVSINIDQSTQRREVKERAICYQGDVLEFLNKLEFAKSYPEWLHCCQKWKTANPVIKETYSGDNIYKVIGELSRVSKEGDIIVSDAGSAFYCTSQAIQLKVGQRYITSGAMATMGFSVPAAIGAYYATGRPVWAVTGDGSLQQCLAELSLLEGLPIKVVVLDNGGYLSIRNSQKNYYKGRLLGESPPCSVPYHSNVLVARCDPNQEILPSVQSWVNPDGSMSSAALESMKT